MARSTSYRLEDEPRPGALARLAVEPLWPLLALMLAGAWLGLPWFVLNGFAVGSPSRYRELVLASLCMLGSVAIGFALLYAWQTGYLESKAGMQYAMLVLVVWKLAIGYILFSLQSSTIELYQYYGGVLSRWGLPIALLGAFLLRSIVLGLLPFTLWLLVMS